MVKTRLIACLLWRDGLLIQSRNFKHTNAVGNAFVAVEFFNNWAIDEIVLLNVSRNGDNWEKFIVHVRELSRRCFVPLTVGGFIKNCENIRELLAAGADKVCINSAAFKHPELIRDGAKTYGNQCIVVSIDAKKTTFDEVHINQGTTATGMDVVDWSKKAEKLGAGEIFLTSIDKDGSLKGYDIDMLKKVSLAVGIPVIASGGAGEWQHFVDAIVKGKSDAVSAANIFHYSEQSTKKAKDFMNAAGINIRQPAFYEISTPRLPTYDMT